jgi:hypothetical protein
VVALDEAADRASAGLGLGDVGGGAVDELGAFFGDGADEHRHDADQQDKAEQEDEQGGQRAAQMEAVLDQVGDRPEDDAEQGGDHDPGQHPADLPAE